MRLAMLTKGFDALGQQLGNTFVAFGSDDVMADGLMTVVALPDVNGGLGHHAALRVYFGPAKTCKRIGATRTIDWVSHCALPFLFW